MHASIRNDLRHMTHRTVPILGMMPLCKSRATMTSKAPLPVKRRPLLSRRPSMRIVARGARHPVARFPLACALPQCLPLTRLSLIRSLRAAIRKEDRRSEQVIARLELLGALAQPLHADLALEVTAQAY
jgi:hypothetical protein